MSYLRRPKLILLTFYSHLDCMFIAYPDGRMERYHEWIGSWENSIISHKGYPVTDILNFYREKASVEVTLIGDI